MEAVYSRATPRHKWRLQAVKFEGAMDLAKALTAQARERRHSLQCCIVPSYGDHPFPESFYGDPNKGTILSSSLGPG